MKNYEYTKFNRAVEKLKWNCYRRSGLFVERLANGWEVTVTESGLDRRWTVRRDGRKVAATFRLRPTLLDIRDKEDMSYANALFHALGMEDRVRKMQDDFVWNDGRTVTPLTQELKIPELPPSPPFTIFKYGRHWDPKDLERFEREKAEAEAEAKTEESD